MNKIVTAKEYKLALSAISEKQIDIHTHISCIIWELEMGQGRVKAVNNKLIEGYFKRDYPEEYLLWKLSQ